MSSLLKEAIIDARALKEAALQNAEAAILEKYSTEVKDTIDKLLEQGEMEDLELGGDLSGEEMGDPSLGEDPAVAPADPAGMEMPGEPMQEEVEEVTEDTIPLAAVDGLSSDVGIGLEETPNEGAEVEFNVDLGALSEAIQDLRTQLEEDEEIEINEEDLVAALEEADPGSFAGEESAELDTGDDEGAADSGPALAGSAAAEEADVDAMKAAGLEEDYEMEISEELIDAVMERLTVDMGATLKGWAGRSSEDIKWELTKALAHRRSTDFQDELEDLRKAHDELVFENNQLKEHNKKYKHTVDHLQENLQDINLSNARLLYTNRVLRNTSLNERQKEKIVEAISNAGSVTEAKTIFSTLQSTMETKQTKRSPQSLSEAIGRQPSFIRATRQESKPVDTLSDRMKKLAGIT